MTPHSHQVKRYPYLAIALLVAVLVWIGHCLYGVTLNYNHLSEANVNDIFRAKLWSLSWLMAIGFFIYWKRSEPWIAAFSVFALSAYFVILYGILFKGTAWGMNGPWGDNFYRLSMTNKMMAYGGFPDAHQKDLPALYPPLWFWMMAQYAKLIGIEAYQTLKYGYLFLFLVYPWALYFMWRRLVMPATAAFIVVGVIFVSHEYLNYIGYEHFAAGLFLPWWLYYVEDAGELRSAYSRHWRFYATGALIGGALFMLYYWWFALLAAAFPLSLILRYAKGGSRRDSFSYVRHVAIILTGAALVSAPYWAPLLISLWSAVGAPHQATWFQMVYADLTTGWEWRNVLTCGGILSAAALWYEWKNARILLLAGAGLLLICVDRALNIVQLSDQSRKIIEFSFVFAMAPLALGVRRVLESAQLSTTMKRMTLAAGTVAVVVSANEHSEVLDDPRYRAAINQRVDSAMVSALKATDYSSASVLTDWYVEGSFVPYFMFIPKDEGHAHPAGQLKERLAFLKSLETVQESALMSYALGYNRFERVSQAWLSWDNRLTAYLITSSEIPFNSPATLDSLTLPASAFGNALYTQKSDTRGVFFITPPTRSDSLDATLREKYPEVAKYLRH